MCFIACKMYQRRIVKYTFTYRMTSIRSLQWMWVTVIVICAVLPHMMINRVCHCLEHKFLYELFDLWPASSITAHTLLQESLQRSISTISWIDMTLLFDGRKNSSKYLNIYIHNYTSWPVRQVLSEFKSHWCDLTWGDENDGSKGLENTTNVCFSVDF